MFFIFLLTLFYLIVVFVVLTHEIPLLLTSRWLSRLGFACFIAVLLFVHVAYLFLLFFTPTIECNPMIGSHTGGLLGSLQPSIQAH